MPDKIHSVDNPRIKTLIIEDDRTSRLLANESLSLYRTEMLDKYVATDMADGFKKFNHILPDVIFLDIKLPDGCGLNALPKLLAISPQTFIVMMTGCNDARHVYQAKQNGAMGYILKPFSRQRIHDTMNAYLHYRDLLQSLPEDERNTESIRKIRERCQSVAS